MLVFHRLTKIRHLLELGPHTLLPLWYQPPTIENPFHYGLLSMFECAAVYWQRHLLHGDAARWQERNFAFFKGKETCSPNPFFFPQI